MKYTKERELLEDILVNICENTHANCNCNCPIYNVMTEKEKNNNDSACVDGCFKNGSKMANILLERAK